MIKRLVCFYIPALITVVYVFSWNWSDTITINIMGVLAILDVVLGARLYFQPTQYDGAIVVRPAEDGKKILTLEFNNEPITLHEKQNVSFKVISESS